MSKQDPVRRSDAESGAPAGTKPEEARAPVDAPQRVVVRTGDTGDTLAAGVADTAMSAPEDPSLSDTMAAGGDMAAGGGMAAGGDDSIANDATQAGPVTPYRGARRAQSGDEDMVDSLVGQVLLDRYRITKRIGQGGMGAVYEAEHMLIGKRVAVKVLLEHYAQQGSVVARLEQEARLASAIGHEHIVDITDFGETPDGCTFVVMEYLEGESLGDCLRREGTFEEQRAIRIAHQVADALAAAHRKGVVHRDVKPENIFLLRRKDTDFAKVVDFGISKSLHTGEGGGMPRLTQTGVVLGTPLYMSPEQARGEENLDQRIDIYALGVILYEMVTGDVPFRGNNSLSVIAQVINDAPVSPREHRPELSAELEAVILHAMAKERGDRYASCDALAGDLAALMIDDSLSGSSGRLRISAPMPTRRQSPRRARMHSWLGGLAVGAVAMLGLVLWMSMGEDEPPPPAPAPVPAAIASPPEPETEALPEPEETVSTPERVTIDVVSDPPEATIYEGSRVRGSTPHPLVLLRKDETLHFTAKLDGYQDAEFDINPYRDEGQKVLIHLEPVEAMAPELPPRRRRPSRVERAPQQSPSTSPRTGSGSGTAAGELGGNPYTRTGTE
ncbi:serine/threonine-protein kinase [Haliangium ochraceum]|uniref:non-specific serine/threonine protein kinase n=1 Tax=Haliangium ochraceum (strain DSM 14365 / JCM 11303 / SMP-2) TaxID=502025 RepID=D0LY10_HALO1|nr:serine/threonine-protein kinase [Haliangium ochraceum]ACY14365.1 serine/threonine protein kinase [Haliangium ochraceum DSM 14365]